MPLLLLLVLLLRLLLIQDPSPTVWKVPPGPASLDEYMQTGWLTIDTIAGDLNKDGARDMVVVYKNPTASREWIERGKFGVVVLLRDKKSQQYHLVDSSSGFSGGYSHVILAEPRQEWDGKTFEVPGDYFHIHKGALVFYHYWGGPRYHQGHTVRYRYQNNRMEAVGYVAYRKQHGDDERQNATLVYDYNLTNGKVEFSRNGKSTTLTLPAPTPMPYLGEAMPLTRMDKFPPFFISPEVEAHLDSMTGAAR